MCGKGDIRRPCLIGKEEEDLRYRYAFGEITFAQFRQEYEQLEQEGKIVRSGRKMNV